MAMTLEQLLRKTDDGVLLDIQEELLSGVVPATGPSHCFVRHVNRMIDKGELCINPTTYRKVYLPTLAKAVQKEMARRYTRVLKGQLNPASIIDDSCEQTAISLVANNEQAGMEDAK
jgi:hypothetical protein